MANDRAHAGTSIILNLNCWKIALRALQITQTQSFGPFTDLVNQPLAPALQQFDNQGGYRTLDSVNIEASSSVTGSLSGSISNPTNSNQNFTYTASVTNVQTSVSGPGISGVSNSAATLLSYASGSQIIPAHGTFTVPAQSQTVTATGGATLTNGTDDLSAFLGAGTFSYVTNAHADSSGTLTGSGNLQQNIDFSTTGETSVTVVYDYHTNPMIDVTKAATGIQEGGVGNQNVTYTYTVQNTNPNSVGHPLTLTQLNDDKLGNLLTNPSNFQGGDTNNNGALDFGETWTYQVTTLFSVENAGITVHNTVTATGQDSEGTTPPTRRMSR